MGSALGCFRGCDVVDPAPDRHRLPVVSEPQPRRPAGPPQKQPKADCSICCRDMLEVSIPRDQPLSKRCTHKRQVCEACVKKHIHEEVMIKSNVNIVCIDANCRERMDHGDVRRLANKEDFEQYDMILVKRTLEANPEFRWCSRAGCGCGQLHADREALPIMNCHACRSKTCFNHHCPWHTDRTCKQYDEDAKQVEEVALLQLLRRSHFRRCPKCNHAIEKAGGCDHMTCKRSAGGCGAEFCWLCLADYRGSHGIKRLGNKAHAVTCRYYA